MKGTGSFSLTVVVCLCIAVVSAFAQTEYRVSAPYTYENLTIFLIHGADTSSNKNLITLQEAMEMKVFKVYETDDVNELIVENISPIYDVFIQSGDIVKGGKQEKALREIRSVVGFVIEDLIAENEPIPEPLGRRSYSGKLNVRRSKELHRRLALESSVQGVSLNTLINTKLARS